MKRLSLSVLLLSTLVACGGGGGDDGNVSRSCDFPAEGTCDVVTSTAAVLDAAGLNQASCTNSGGTYGAVCGPTNRVGRCTVTETSGTLTFTLVESFYSPSWTAVTAEAECVNGLGGTFTAN